MKWELAIIAAAVLAVAGVSRRLTGASGSPAMVFVLIGVPAGPLVLDEVAPSPTGAFMRTLAEGTLTVVLFADASRIKLIGSGFIAAFVARIIFDRLARTESEEASRFNEELGALLGGIAFLVFGAVLLGPALKYLSWQIALYAVLSLTVIRTLPDAISMIGADAKLPTRAFLGWFGPGGIPTCEEATSGVRDSRFRSAHGSTRFRYRRNGHTARQAWKRSQGSSPGSPTGDQPRQPGSGRRAHREGEMAARGPVATRAALAPCPR